MLTCFLYIVKHTKNRLETIIRMTCFSEEKEPIITQFKRIKVNLFCCCTTQLFLVKYYLVINVRKFVESFSLPRTKNFYF